MTLLPLTLALLLALPAFAHAADRVDFFDPKGQRTGYATVDQGTGRIDYYDPQSRRTGWGQVEPSGRVEQFDLKGHRVAPRAGPGVPIIPPPSAPARR